MWIRRWWAVATAALAVVSGLVVWLVWPSSKGTYDPPARMRQYNAFTACLLTGPAGLADAQAKMVWSGIEAASSETSARVTYLSVPASGPDTVGSASPLANTLVQQHCDVIIAVGAAEVEAVQAVAAKNASIRFVLVGGGSAAGNVAVLPQAGVSSIQSRVQTAVQDAVSGRFHPGVMS